MKVDGIGFNTEWCASHTLAEFLREFDKYDHIFPDAKDRKEKLKEAWQLHQPKSENPQVPSEE